MKLSGFLSKEPVSCRLKSNCRWRWRVITGCQSQDTITHETRRFYPTRISKKKFRKGHLPLFWYTIRVMVLLSRTIPVEAVAAFTHAANKVHKQYTSVYYWNNICTIALHCIEVGCIIGKVLDYTRREVATSCNVLVRRVKSLMG
jgi:hypothetical protein